MKNFTICFTALFVFGLFFTATSSATESDNIYKKLTVQLCDSLINANETNPNFVIIDVRTPSQWLAEHLQGSINRNYYDSDFTEQLDALPRHKTYLIHCQSGGRSSGTFTKMQNLGFAEVYDMQGGISSWKSASLPTTSEIAPKLMLVSKEEIRGTSNTDSIKITVTNRANDILSFSSLELFDIHNTYSDFDVELELEGAEDYTFYVFHEPGYTETDSTCIILESNGGQLDIDVVFKNGVIQTIPEQEIAGYMIFPNPASDYLQFNANTVQLIDKIRIIDITGKTILLANNFDPAGKLDIGELPTGIHILTLYSGKITQTQKIVINR
ncbi:T9SS type A sorting domain-containing protein [Maribellus comscasis]|uniref:T9SS type A sorting domain-containing protein n=1 Tax=Maribellus comscasis TaxID=2681766 RepID=A0A6I6JPU2_9BACT|nr:rhodanese-like domain-containing protein [Maribellus comscasis]QGY42127.1 T9SS type A sorting domain-containing protein [Maribellus comscasis]